VGCYSTLGGGEAIDKILEYVLTLVVEKTIEHGSSGGRRSTNTISLDGASDGVRWGTRP